jgi:hypothetical protein
MAQGSGLKTQRRSRRSIARGLLPALLLVVVCFARPLAQTHFASGQDVQPVFEGWERNTDGSFSMVFGYLNRNYEEEIDVPVGPNNTIEPGGDRGQPAHFYTRRQQFMFKVRVPRDWGNKDMVWSVTVRGKTEKAYGTLMPVWEIDRHVYQQNRAGPGELGEEDDPPHIALVGPAQRTANVGQPITIDTTVQDDGRPTMRPTRSGTGNTGRANAAPQTVAPRPQNPVTQSVVKLDPGMRLGVIWIVHRRSTPAVVKFVPPKVPVVEGKASTAVTFTTPGTYVLRGYADDGILLDSADVTVVVAP